MENKIENIIAIDFINKIRIPLRPEWRKSERIRDLEKEWVKFVKELDKEIDDD